MEAIGDSPDRPERDLSAAIRDLETNLGRPLTPEETEEFHRHCEWIFEAQEQIKLPEGISPDDTVSICRLSPDHIRSIFAFSEWYAAKKSRFENVYPRDILTHRSGALFSALGYWKLMNETGSSGIEKFERDLLEIVTPYDVLALAHIGENVEPAYIPIMSKLIEGALGGPNLGMVYKPRDIERRREEMDNMTGHLLKRKHLQELRIVFSLGADCQENTTPAQRVSGSSYAFFHAIDLHPDERISATYRSEISRVIIQAIASIMLKTYFFRDKESFTQEMKLETLCHILITARLALYAEFWERGVPFEDMENMVSSEKERSEALDLLNFLFSSLIIEAIGPELTARFKEQFPAGSLDALIAEVKTSSDFADILKHTPLLFISMFNTVLHIKRGRAPYSIINTSGEDFLKLAERVPLARTLIWQKSLWSESQSFTAAIQFADNPYELIKYGHSSAACIEEVRKKLGSKPEWIPVVIRETGIIIDRKAPEQLRKPLNFAVALFTPEFFEEYPTCFESFLDCFRQPAASTFYQACAVAAHIIQKENGEGLLAQKFLEGLLQDASDFVNVLKTTALRYILERLSGKAYEKFLEMIYDQEMQALSPEMPVGEMSADERTRAKDIEEFLESGQGTIISLEKMLGQHGQFHRDRHLKEQRRKDHAGRAAERRREQQVQYEAPMKLLRSLSENPYEPRDLASVIQNIVEHRSIQLSPDGHDVPLASIPSALATTFQRVRIRRNQDTGKPPLGLGCNAVLYKDALAVYARIKTDGSLVLRLLDNTGQEKETIERIDAERAGITLALFDELHFVILEALKIIYVRVESESGPHPVVSGEIPMPQQNEGAVPSDASVFVTGLPDTHEREEGVMRVSLTPRQRSGEERRERQEKLRLDMNKAKVVQVFLPLKRRERLPEESPAATSTLQLFIPELVDAHAGQRRRKPKWVTVYKPVSDPTSLYHVLRAGEMNSNGVFVRVRRAFVQPLSYVPFRRSAIYEDEFGQVHTKPFFAIRQKRPSSDAEIRHIAFMTYEGGEEFALDPIIHNLHFEASERQDPAVRGIVETMRRQALFGLALRRPNLTSPEEEELDRIDQTEEVAPGIFELPQGGFSFYQTFNYGTFVSLRDLLEL